MPDPHARSVSPIEPPTTAGAETPFGANEMRLTARDWFFSLGLVLLITFVTPRVWPKIERFDTGSDYRIPYELSNDYWLYGRRLRQVTDSNRVLVLGDSVVWGEYVLPDGTLSHFLNRELGETNRFVNVGVNGFFPLALEGLIRYDGQALHHQKILLQCNVLWMTSPEADLSTDKEEPFNHATLVPQYFPRIPCYKAGAEERLSAMVDREAGCMGWVSHLQNCYFGQKSIPKWTLDEGGGNPSHSSNAYKNPLAQITLRVPSALKDDPQRGPNSPRHKPWSNGKGTTHFDWVRLNSSLQWQAFERVIALLRARGNDVLVVLGPFNEHIMAEDNRAAYRTLRDGIADWLRQNQVSLIVPATLPSELYADASHPLTEGYQLLATRICADASFQQWSKRPNQPGPGGNSQAVELRRRGGKDGAAALLKASPVGRVAP
ncbi:MAG TPA: hypothetical protein PK640_14375 [Verrucomicrobiota bacterium]|nr:hypothetical protein [Verrucomicrobiota bacterium]